MCVCVGLTCGFPAGVVFNQPHPGQPNGGRAEGRGGVLEGFAAGQVLNAANLTTLALAHASERVPPQTRSLCPSVFYTRFLLPVVITLFVKHKQPFTHTPTDNFELSIHLTCMVFALWEEAGENTQRHREDGQTPHREVPGPGNRTDNHCVAPFTVFVHQ